MKKLVCLMLVLCMAFSLAACSGGTADKGSEKTAAPSDVATSSPEATHKPVTLTLWLWDESQQPGTQAAIDAFEAKYDWIKVEISCIAYADYVTKVNAVLGTADAPSVFWMSGALSKDYLKSGYIQNLSDYIAADNYDTSVFNSAVLDAYSLNGGVYAIPKDYDGYAVVYNKSLFDAAGVAYPKNDWTWDDFTNTAKALTSDGIYGFAGSTADRVWNSFVLSNGGKLYSDDGLTATVNSPKAVEAYTFLYDMLKNGYSASYNDLTETGADTLFINGMAAMDIIGSWYVDESYAALGKNLGIVEVPTSPAGNKAIITHGIGYATTTANPNLDDTWLLLQYLGSADAQRQLIDVVVPANTDCASEWADKWKAQGVDVTPMTNSMEYAVFLPLAAVDCQNVRAALSTEINNLIAGTYASPADALAKAQTNMQALIDAKK